MWRPSHDLNLVLWRFLTAPVPAGICPTESEPSHMAPLLPAEVIDLIASEVLLPADLLSLALAHSSFRDAVIPAHLNYRVIECFIDDGVMWGHLEENSRRLQNIRFLKLHNGSIYDSDLQWSSRPSVAGTPRPYLLQPSLLREMGRLHAFQWHHFDHEGDEDFPTPLTTRQSFINYQDNLWTTLKERCLDLKEVDVDSSFGCGNCPSRMGNAGLEAQSTNVRVRSATVQCCSSADHLMISDQFIQTIFVQTLAVGMRLMF